MKITEKVYLAYYTNSPKDRPQFMMFTAPIKNDANFLHVATSTVEFDVDDAQDFTLDIVQALRKQQETIRAESQAALTKLDERINSLLAIECKVAA